MQIEVSEAFPESLTLGGGINRSSLPASLSHALVSHLLRQRDLDGTPGFTGTHEVQVEKCRIHLKRCFRDGVPENLTFVAHPSLDRCVWAFPAHIHEEHLKRLYQYRGELDSVFTLFTLSTVSVDEGGRAHIPMQTINKQRSLIVSGRGSYLEIMSPDVAVERGWTGRFARSSHMPSRISSDDVTRYQLYSGALAESHLRSVQDATCKPSDDKGRLWLGSFLLDKDFVMVESPLHARAKWMIPLPAFQKLLSSVIAFDPGELLDDLIFRVRGVSSPDAKGRIRLIRSEGDHDILSTDFQIVGRGAYVEVVPHDLFGPYERLLMAVNK